MDNNKVAGVNDVQEQCTDKSANVESVSPATVDKGEMIEYFSSSHKKFFEGFRKKTKPVSRIGRIDFWGEEAKAIRKIASEMSRRNG